MPFDVPTLSEMIELTRAALRGRIPTADVSQFSATAKRLYTTALVGADLHEHLRQVQRDLMPDTAEGAMLARHGKLKGKAKKAAVGAATDVALRVFGDAAATVSSLEELLHVGSGLRFQTTSGGVINADGYLDVDVAAIDTGAVTNLTVGEELQFVSTPTGLEQTATIVIDLEGGQDVEQDGPYRQRILDAWADPARGGDRTDWRVWALEALDAIATGYAYPHRNGRGTVDVAALKTGSGASRLLTAPERALLDAAIALVAPINAQPRTLEVTSLAVDVEALLLPLSGGAWDFDWNDSTPLTVASWDAATLTLTFETARPVDMQIGDRLTVSKASGGDGKEMKIVALSGTDAVVVEELPAVAPANPDKVYAGGPLVSLARAATLSLFDALGPANPNGKYGPWDGTLRTAVLFETIQELDGVLDSSLSSPAANVEADDPGWPNNTTIELLIPGQLLFRRWW